jgi:hypothetical protein
MTAVPWYCRYGVHGDIAKQTNIDGTVIYRTRERPCDCVPPAPTPPATSLPVRRAPQRPRRPATAGDPLQRLHNRGRRTHPRSIRESPCGMRCAVASVLSCEDYPLGFYAGGLEVVVPPIAEERSGGVDVVPWGSSVTPPNCGGEWDAVYPVLPSIPVVWPQPDLPTWSSISSQCGGSSIAKADLTLPPSSHSDVAPTNTNNTSNITTTATTSTPAVPLAATEQALPLADTTAGPVTDNSTAVPLPSAHPPSAAGACAEERHTLHAQWGIAYCSMCGVPLQPITAAMCTPQTCPLGPHVRRPPSSTPSAETPVINQYCMLCGAVLQSPAKTPPPAGVAASPAMEEEAAGHTTSTLPALRTDLQSVDAIMAHLLDNANARGGRVQSPCGLPHCLLCDGIGGATAGDTNIMEGDGKNLPVFGRWSGSGPVMCGSPAVAIIHHHYYCSSSNSSGASLTTAVSVDGQRWH